MSDLHWLTTLQATTGLLLFEAGVYTLEDVRFGEHVPPEDRAARPDAFADLQSDDPAVLRRGLRAISDGRLDVEAFTRIAGVLLEGLVMEDLTVTQVVATLRLLDRKLHTPELVMTDALQAVFTRDGITLGTYPMRLDALIAGHSTETLDALRADVDDFLSGYAST